MITGNVIIKRFAMVMAVASFITATGFNGNLTKASAKSQMMEISCPHCHEYITIDVLLDDVECPQCLKNIHIDG